MNLHRKLYNAVYNKRLTIYVNTTPVSVKGSEHTTVKVTHKKLAAKRKAVLDSILKDFTYYALPKLGVTLVVSSDMPADEVKKHIAAVGLSAILNKTEELKNLHKELADTLSIV
jgi:hypothetical protein